MISDYLRRDIITYSDRPLPLVPSRYDPYPVAHKAWVDQMRDGLYYVRWSDRSANGFHIWRGADLDEAQRQIAAYAATWQMTYCYTEEALYGRY